MRETLEDIDFSGTVSGGSTHDRDVEDQEDRSLEEMKEKARKNPGIVDKSHPYHMEL